MFIWYYVELVLMVLLPLIVVTQLMVPAFTNKPIFPFFRRIFKKKEVEEEIRELKVARDRLSKQIAIIEARRRKIQCKSV